MPTKLPKLPLPDWAQNVGSPVDMVNPLGMVTTMGKPALALATKLVKGDKLKALAQALPGGPEFQMLDAPATPFVPPPSRVPNTNVEETLALFRRILARGQ